MTPTAAAPGATMIEYERSEPLSVKELIFELKTITKSKATTTTTTSSNSRSDAEESSIGMLKDTLQSDPSLLFQCLQTAPQDIDLPMIHWMEQQNPKCLSFRDPVSRRTPVTLAIQSYLGTQDEIVAYLVQKSPQALLLKDKLDCPTFWYALNPKLSPELLHHMLTCLPEVATFRHDEDEEYRSNLAFCLSHGRKQQIVSSGILMQLVEADPAALHLSSTLREELPLYLAVHHQVHVNVVRLMITIHPEAAKHETMLGMLPIHHYDEVRDWDENDVAILLELLCVHPDGADAKHYKRDSKRQDLFFDLLKLLVPLARKMEDNENRARVVAEANTMVQQRLENKRPGVPKFFKGLQRP